MAAIYSGDGMPITEGLQGSDACDEAINCARVIADERGEPVYLDDDDGSWIVYPAREDGSRPACSEVEETDEDRARLADEQSEFQRNWDAALSAA